ncbi:MAG: endonuclease/exonuclease/phosphatase family protein [Chitinophagales bacterium]|nr:endonuclease/exonuclease/phosphatase family protein [Chitinophagales bacterium]
MPERPIKFKILTTFSVILALATVLALFAPFVFGFQNMDHHLNYFLITMIITGLIGFFLNSKSVLYINFLCAGLLTFYLKTTTFDRMLSPSRNASQAINIAAINLNVVENNSFIHPLLKDTSINIIVFQQCNPDWDYILQPILAQDFPYQAKLIQLGHHGMAIYSKIPIVQVDTFMIGNFPAIQSSFKGVTDAFKLLSVYIPEKSESNSQRDIDLIYKDLHNFVAQNNHKNIIIGQFNQTYWSQNILHLKTTLHLYNSRRIIYPIVTSMPQDHIFYTGDLECYAFGEIIGAPRTRIGSKAFFQINQSKSTPTPEK